MSKMKLAWVPNFDQELSIEYQGSLQTGLIGGDSEISALLKALSAPAVFQ